MKRLAPVEFLRGFVAVLPICFKVGWIGVTIAALAGLLFMLGGTFLKSIRRFGVPILTCGVSCIILHNIWILVGVPIGFGILSIGDGFPDRRLGTYDRGSWLGRLVERILDPIDQESIDGCGEVTKWCIVVLFQLALIPVYLS